jgi:dihydrofolate reductase
MKRCSVFIATSVDGFIARENGAIDWLSIVERPDEDYGYAKFFDSVDTLVIGRKTYETALGFEAWPYANKRVIVMTHQARKPKFNEELFSGDPKALALRLAESKRVYVDGGSVIRQFLAAKLVTDMTLSIVPVLLGSGIRLFDALPSEVRLELLSARDYESGLVQIHYVTR